MKPPHIKAHRRIWLALAVILPICFVAALAAKVNTPHDAPAIQLEAAPTKTN